MKDLTIVVPCYRDQEVLPELHRRLGAVLGPTGLNYDILLVNDGSPDDTWSVIRKLHASDPDHVRGVNLSRNFGHQIAVTCGLDHTDAGAVIVMDSDLQDPPEFLPQLIAKWKEGFDVVSATRAKRESESCFKRLMAGLFYWLFNKLSPVPIAPQSGEFRLMSRPVVETLKGIRERHRFIRGLTVWTGFRQTMIPCERKHSLRDTSGYTLGRMLGLAADGIVSFSVVPLRMAALMGAAMFLVSLLLVVSQVILKLMNLIPVRGWTMLFTVMALFGGLQLLFIGLVGEYVGRIYEEVKRRPLYIIADRLEGALGAPPR